MHSHPLFALSPIDGRYHNKVASLAPYFSEFGLMHHRIKVEISWLIHFAKAIGLPISENIQSALTDLIAKFSLQDAELIKEIEAKTNHDVKAIEYFIKQKLSLYPEFSSLNEFIHIGCTSEDINNLAYALMLQHANLEVLTNHLQKLIDHLRHLAHQYAPLAMLARTHGQAASPTTLGKEIANIVARLQKPLDELKQFKMLGKFNGATGNYNALAFSYPDIDWKKVCAEFVTGLNLNCNAYTTQIEPHDNLAALFAIITRINTILLDFSRDIWAYISIHYFIQQPKEQEVGSSTMPHKINPIDFENAEGNLGLANGLFFHMMAKLPISRWQRDLSDSTVMRSIGSAFAYSLIAYLALLSGINKLNPNIALIQKDLDQHWEVIAEAIQTVMRRYQLKNPYERLKDFTRGKTINRDILHAFIQTLELPLDVKNQLLSLKPEEYIGYAKDLALEI